MSAEHSSRRLVVIAHADVAGSTELIRQDEVLAHRRIRDVFQRFSGIISRYGGKAQELRGDALLAEFARASDAVAACLVFQGQNEAHNRELEDAIRPRLRIGLTLGEVVIADGTMTGPDVVLAQRIEQVARPGGVCVSAALRQAVPQRLPFRFEDAGEHALKGFDEAMRIFTVALESGHEAPAPETRARRAPGARYGVAAVLAIVILGVLGWWRPWAPGSQPADGPRPSLPLPEKPSIAVLPFDNLSGDAEQAYFGDGIVDDLITDLSRLPELFVIARNSTFAYKGEAVRVQKVAEALGVRYVVEGSVRRSGDVVRINVQLVDALRGHHLWAERYDGAMSDIFELQDRITARIVAALSLRLAPGALGPRQEEARPVAPEAYDAVLLGWNFLRLRRVDPQGYVAARDAFARALALEPEYRRAHLSMAAAYWWGSWNDEARRLGVGYQEGIDIAKAHLQVAMETPFALGHRIRAEMYREEGQFERAVEEAALAVRLDPNNPHGHEAVAFASIRIGEARKALRSLDAADRLDPGNVVDRWVGRGLAHFVLGDDAEAARLVELAVAAEPDFKWHYPWLLAIYGHLGRVDEARTAIERMNALLHATGRGPFTLEDGIGRKRFAVPTLQARFVAGLRKAGLEPGDDPASLQLALDTLVTRTTEGHFRVEGVTTVDAARVRALLDEGALVLDVRGIGSWRVGHVPGALHAERAIGALTEANLAGRLGKDDPVVFYCAGFT